MNVEVLNTLGWKCPHPVLKVAVRSLRMQQGDILEVLGDCPTFEKDVRTWCQRLGKILVSVQDIDARKRRIQIQF